MKRGLNKKSLRFVLVIILTGATFLKLTLESHPFLLSSTIIITKPRIVIGGAAKNDAKHLQIVKASIRRLQQDFDIAGMVFYENDSKDETLQELQRWKDEFKNIAVTVLTERNVTSRIPSRIQRLAHARNQLMTGILKMSLQTPFDYLLLLDMDESSGHMSGVSHCLALPQPWHVCCANQYQLYYDLLALSTYDDWMPCYWYDCPEEIQRTTFRHIPASRDPILVKSCFSGAALYNWKLLQHLDRLDFYTGIGENGQEECEHKNFLRNLQTALGGGNLSVYIQPKMLTDGSGGTIGWFPENELKRPLWEASWNNASMKEYYDYRFDP